MVKAAVFGATGYTGLEIIRLLLKHPDVSITLISSETYSGSTLSAIYPHLNGLCDMELSAQSVPGLIASGADVLFCALPHGVPMTFMKELSGTSVRVIDLSADFRLRKPGLFESWYKTSHSCPDLLSSFVYGIPEVRREQIKSAVYVANPGCYPTSVILALAPLLKKGIINPDTIISDSKSGVSGAGRGLNEGNIFCECDEDFRAYSSLTHRHTPEIEQELGELAGGKARIMFTPHLLPMKRGIFSTLYVDLLDGVGINEVENAYQCFYENERFVRYLGTGKVPRTRNVYGTNFCDIGIQPDESGRRLVIFSAIDNMGKGACGQAVQNMNLMFSLDEGRALMEGAMVP